jgi:hypothetical protein
MLIAHCFEQRVQGFFLLFMHGATSWKPAVAIAESLDSQGSIPLDAQTIKLMRDPIILMVKIKELSILKCSSN